MDQQNNTPLQQTPSQPAVNQQITPPATPPHPSQPKKLIIVLGVIILIVITAGIGLKFMPQNTKQTTATTEPTEKLGFQDIMHTKTEQALNKNEAPSLNTNRPIIIVKSQKIIAIDPENTSKEETIYQIPHGFFFSAKLSPDGKNLAYSI